MNYYKDSTAIVEVMVDCNAMKLPKALFPDVFKFWTQHDNLNDELNYAARTGDLKMIDMILKMLPDVNPNVKVKVTAGL